MVGLRAFPEKKISIGLPAGTTPEVKTLADLSEFRVSPLTAGDIAAAVRVFGSVEKAVDGEVLVDEGDLAATWSMPTFDLATMSIRVFEGDRMIACGEVLEGRAEVAVVPDRWGRGIGEALARWTWEVAAAAGMATVGQTVSDRNERAHRLFGELGYFVGWQSWILRRSITAGMEPPDLGPGITLRPIRRPEDDRVVFDVIDAAFNEWRDRPGWSFEDWRAGKLEHPSSRPDLSVIAEVDGSPVGAGIAFIYEDDAQNEGWVEQIAVAKSHRGRGLGRAMLTQMFRNFAAAGRPQAGLATDSRTGALSLYEHVGMSVAESYTRFTKDLGMESGD